MNIYELREKSLKIAHEARDLLNTVKEDNSNFAEVQTQFERMMADSNSFAARADLAEKAEARSKSFDEIVTETPVVENRSGNLTEEKRSAAFDAYLRGKKTLGELRAMGIGDKEGAITPKSFSTNLLTRLRTETPMFNSDVVTLLNTETGNDIEMPTFDDTVEAVIIGENTQLPEDDLSFGSKTLGAFKYTSKIVRISNELLQDNSINAEGVVSGALSRRVSRGVGRHMTVGTGVGQPKGLVTSASVGITTALGTAIAADELIKAKYSVDPAYHGSMMWMFETAGFVKIQTLRDADGNFVWRPGLTVGAPDTLLNLPYVLNPHMNGDFSTGKIVGLIGDFSKYIVRQAGPLRVIRLSERYADYDQTAFAVLGRWDGVLTDDAAVKSIKLA